MSTAEEQLERIRQQQREASKRYKEANREKVLAKMREYRQKNKEYFRQKKQEEKERIKNDPEYRANVLAVRRALYEKNKEKMCAYSKAYNEAHKEERKAYRKANSEHRVATARAWQKANAERYAETQKKWKENNRHIIRMHIALRRARIMKATTGNPKEIAAWEKEWKSRPTNTCEWCRMEVPTDQCESDHAEPLIHGGPHNLDNLVIACWACNNRKRGKPLSKWLDILGADES